MCGHYYENCQVGLYRNAREPNYYNKDYKVRLFTKMWKPYYIFL
jgi:hypothetical protein